MRHPCLTLLMGTFLLAFAACQGAGEENGNTPTPALGDQPLVAISTLAPTPTLVPPLATTAAASPTPIPPPTLTPSPTPTPRPDQLLARARDALHMADYDLVIVTLDELESQTGRLPDDAWPLLARALVADSRFEEARRRLATYLSQSDASPTLYAYLAESEAALGDCAAAAATYDAFAAAHPEINAYVAARQGRCFLNAGERPAAINAFESAVAAPAHRITAVENRYTLAELYLADGRFLEAAALYDEIRTIAQTEFTRGSAAYLAGQALLAAGDETGAFERYATAVADYPRAPESYLSLIALLDAEIAVDNYDRGIVDFYAGAYVPGVAALENYLSDPEAPRRDDARLFLAWSLEALGRFDDAAAVLEAALPSGNDEETPLDDAAATAWLERAAILGRNGRTPAALAAYDDFVRLHPDHPRASDALYDSAWLAARLVPGSAEAIDRWARLAERYPDDSRAAEALFRAGLAGYQNELPDEAIFYWRKAANKPDQGFGAAAMVWLLRHGPAEDAAHLRERAAALTGDTYYHFRARDIAADRAPYAPYKFDPVALTPGPESRTDFEQWLAKEIDSAEPLAAELSPVVAADTRLRRGATLWEIGWLEEAKREMETVRTAWSDDPVVSYQLAHYFAEIGLYRSSILAARSVLDAVALSEFEAPSYLLRMLYPTHYAPAIIALASNYGYDPLIQFALVRQESLFESFAVSGAAAKGLSQVIPSTGEYIAGRLDWPDYEDSDLYRPVVGLAFGAYYLDELINIFEGDIGPALAGYNGGPGNAAVWYETAGGDHDALVEAITFRETRLYLQRIYIGHAIYGALYGESRTPSAGPH